MATIQSINVAFTAETSGFKKGGEQVTGILAQIRNQAIMAEAALAPFAIVIAAAGAAAGVFAGAVTAITSMTLAGTENIDVMQDQARAIGVSTAALSSFQLHAKLAGTDGEILGGAIQKLNKGIGQGSKEFQSGLAQIGLSLEQVRQMKPEQAMMAISDGVSRLGTVAEMTAVNMLIFGKSGAGMNNFLAGGSKAIEESTRLAENLGLKINDIDAANVAKAADTMDVLGTMTKGVSNLFAIEFAPVITEIGQGIIDWLGSIENLRDYIRTTVDIAVSMGAVILDSGNFALNVTKMAGKDILIVVNHIAGLVQTVEHMIGKVMQLAGITPEYSPWLDKFVKDTDQGIKYLDKSIKDYASSESFTAATPRFLYDARLKATQTKPETYGNGQFAQEDEYTAAEKASDKLIESLTLQANTWGMTKDQVEIYKLRLGGVSEEQIKQVQHMQGIIAQQKAWDDAAAKRKKEEEDRTKKMLDEQKKAWEKYYSDIEKMQNRVQGNIDRWAESIKSPFEKTAEELMKLREAAQLGMVTGQEYAAYANKIIADGIKMPEQKFGAMFANSIRSGSQESRTLMLNTMYGRQQPKDNPAETAKLTLEEAKQQTKWLRDLARRPLPQAVSIGG